MKEINKNVFKLLHSDFEVVLQGFKSQPEDVLKYLVNFTIIDIEKRVGKITLFKKDHAGMTIGLTLNDLFEIISTEDQIHFQIASDEKPSTNNYTYDFEKNNMKMICFSQEKKSNLYSSEMSFDILK